jgi:hypothetical protein
LLARMDFSSLVSQPEGNQIHARISIPSCN